MTKEEIKKKAEELYPVKYPPKKQPFHFAVRTAEQSAFTAGAEWMQEQMVKVDKWISIEDRLPEEKGHYWVNTLHNGMQNQFKCYWDGEVWFTTSLNGNINRHTNITHWQPLPEKPKTDKP